VQFVGRDPLTWDGISFFADRLRPFATLGHTNNLGAYLVLTVPLVAAFTHRAVHQRRWLAALTTAALGVCGGTVAFLTLSRAAWAGLGVGLTVLVVGWLATAAKRAALVVGGAAGVCLVLAAGGSALGWFGKSFGDMVYLRMASIGDGAGHSETWRAAWEMFRERPVTGNGLDTFRLGFGRHRTPDFYRLEGDTSPTKAHNEFLHVLATQGALGAVAVFVLLAGLALGGWRAWRRCAPCDRPLVAAVLASLAGFLVTTLTGYCVVGCGGLVVCCAALLSRWQEAAAPEGAGDAASGLRHWPLAAAALVVPLFAVNMGLENLALCVALGGCGVAFAFPLTVGLIPRGSQCGAAARTAGEQPVRWLPDAGLAAVALVAVVVNVWWPLRAGLACGRGDRLLADDPAAARHHYERAAAADPDCDRYLVKLSATAQLCARQSADPADQRRDREQGRRYLERALALVPADPDHHANLARLLDEAAYCDPSQPRLGPAEWDRAMQMDPNNITFLGEAARGAVAVGGLDRARRLARRGLDLYPDDGFLAAQLGACSLAEGRLAEAAQWYETAVHADWGGNVEDQARAYAALATCHLGLGNCGYARDLAGTAGWLYPGWPTAAWLQGQALERLGDGENALQSYRAVLVLEPHHAGAAAGMRRLEMTRAAYPLSDASQKRTGADASAKRR
jgi:tetratricopeptide (TPR) repeat protein